MTQKQRILQEAWLPDGVADQLRADFPDFDFIDAQDPAVLVRQLPGATIVYGFPPVSLLPQAPALRWIQLISAGVPQDLCPVAKSRGITVTNLSGLYGTSIAEHALAMMLILARNLLPVLRHQREKRWDHDVADDLTDLHGRTVALVGLGNIGQGIARLARAFGMRVLGCRRTAQPSPYADRIYPVAELHAMLAEADYVAIAAPLTARTEGMLGPAEFAAMKPGVIYINVSRGGVAQEAALVEALRSGHVAAAGLDVFATEPLAPDHPLWTMPNVIVSPHYSGETINYSDLPAQRFARNLRNWMAQGELEGIVDLDWGY